MTTWRLSKYISQEVLAPMAISLAILSFVLLMGNLLKLTDLIINRGVPIRDIAMLFLYLLPSFFDITLGMAFLIGILIGFSRLSTDHEIVAMKAAGISLWRMTRPVVVIALITTVVLAGISFYAKPLGRKNFKAQVFQILQNRIGKGLEPMVFFHDFEDVVLFAREVEQNGQMRGIFLYDNRDPEITSTISAESGRLFSNQSAMTFSILLQNGALHNHALSGKDTSYRVMNFANYDLNLSFADKNEGKAPRLNPKEMTFQEILTGTGSTPKQQRQMDVEFHKRLALCIVPLLFVLIGIPLGICSPRSGRMGGFSFSLVVFLAYHLLSSFSETLCLEHMQMRLGVLWLPDLFFLLTGLFLYHAAAAEMAPRWLTGLIALFTGKLLRRHPHAHS